ncbi:MAG TPA: tetratricopeptide repeat protein [Nitrospirales bacterium]|nr:tetratricopeptide repeat protein [Nitrospirales bacterium]
MKRYWLECAPGRSCLRFFLTAIFITALPQLSHGEAVHSSSSEGNAALGQLGSIEFPASGSTEAHPHFLRGVAALHSFWYEEAIDAFRQATRIDPDFVMGYWGEAMAHNHPIWGEENVEAARMALEKVSDTATATARERQYLRAVTTLFGEGDKLARDQAYAEQMENLASQYPEDLEATCLYALSLLGLATHYDEKPYRQEKYRVQAGALTLGVYGVNPNHPCAAHYTIHSFDDPIHAILALPQARRYAKIAPGAHHAQHMPAHIFVQLGMWDQAAASNKAGWESSQAWVKDKQLPPSLQDYHSLYWLQYAYLQQGRYNAAAALILEKQEDMAQSSSSDQSQVLGYDRNVSRNYDQMVAAFIMETERWELADQAWNVNDYRFGDEWPSKSIYIREFAQSMATLRNQPVVVQAHPGLNPPISEPSTDSSEPVTAQIWKLQTAALKHLINGDQSDAIRMLDRASALEESLPPPSGPPDLIKPTYELYGEILLGIDRPKDAQQQFERSLFWHPNRARSVLGLARAADQSGNLSAARQAYVTFLNIWSQADSDLPELQEAKQFIQQAAQQ